MKENAARGCKKVQNFPGAPNGAPKSSKTIDLGLFFAAKRRNILGCFANKKAPLHKKAPPINDQKSIGGGLS